MVKRDIFVADFETTVFPGQTYTEVWSAATVKLYSDEPPLVFHSIGDLFSYYFKMHKSILVYMHNLKFDGQYTVYFLLKTLKFTQAFNEETQDFLTRQDMPNKSFIVTISDFGLWYSIVIKYGGHIIEIRDSLKLLPFSLKEIAEGFNTPHKKLDMEYTGERFAGCEITPEEMEYIKNDVLVLKEALEIMFADGHNKLTIGACCFSEFKAGYDKEFSFFFPNLYEIDIDFDQYDCLTAGEYIHKSYRGGWCYIVPGKRNKVIKNGLTLDVNSLYSSEMSGESGNPYPVGKPTFFTKFDKYTLDRNNDYYFIRFRAEFQLKPGYLPTVQIKGSWLYPSNTYLKTSDIWNPNTKKYERYYYDLDGNKQKAFPEITMTKTDYELFLEHYDIYDIEFLDGCYFDTDVGIFDKYINKYKKIKMESTGAKRTIAKLFLNSLYGRCCTTTDSSFKTLFLGDDDILHSDIVMKFDKTPGYIAAGSAITAYARAFTIRAAQANFYGENQRGFIYADTDSIHCDLPIEKIKGVTIDSKKFCCWKHESTWTEGVFVRPKTYVEIIDGVPNIKMAGVSPRGKNVIAEMLGYKTKIHDSMTEAEKEFCKKYHSLDDIKTGIVIPFGKLVPKKYPGGVVLEEIDYSLR